MSIASAAFLRTKGSCVSWHASAMVVVKAENQKHDSLLAKVLVDRRSWHSTVMPDHGPVHPLHLFALI